MLGICKVAIDDHMNTVYFTANCNFEEAVCPWANIRGENFDWMIHTGSTPSSGTGPVTDHTLGTSSGIYKMVYL